MLHQVPNARVYLPDLVVFSKTTAKRIDYARSALTILQDAGSTLEPKKREFFTIAINYLGHVIRARRLQTASRTSDGIRDLKLPTIVKKPETSFGLCNVFCRFVPNFARAAARLNKIHGKDQPTRFGQLTQEETTEINTLQDKLGSPLVPAIPR